MTTGLFYEIVEAIKQTILDYPDLEFKYVERNRWIDRENRLARSAVNLGFSVKIDLIRENDTEFNQEDENLDLLSVNIQFALDANHDNYLNYIGHCIDAIMTLEDMDYSSVELAPIQPYFTSDIIAGLYIMDFDNLNFLIRTK